jgi:insulysin
MDIPANDKRQYETLTLENGLRCLLISDSQADKAAAAVGVAAGQLHDGAFPGVAHLTEHMLFLGTNKYPTENAYDSYLAAAAGHSNAYTDLELTCYYMDCQPSALEGALDRFAACLEAPLVQESSLEKEIQAVDSEHAKNVQSDMWRSMQLGRTALGKCKEENGQDHAFAGFGSGNLQTLLPPTSGTIDKAARIAQLRQAVWEFYKAHYHAGNMSLVILGCESLEQLRKWCQEYFGPLSSQKQTTVAAPPLAALLPAELQWVPVRTSHTLDLQWPCHGIQSQYKSKPARAISHLLGHEGPGSLLYAIREQLQWAQELSADDQSKSCQSFSVFGLSMELTELGLEHVNDIIQMVCYYIQTVCRNIPAWVLQELKTAGDMQFRFLSEQAPADYVSACAAHMHLFDTEHILSGPYKVYENDQADTQQAVQEYLNSLRPENCLVMLASPTVAGTTDQKDPWYGTEYRNVPVPAARVKQWKAPLSDELAKLLHLPARNDMLPTNFDLVVEPTTNNEDDNDMDGKTATLPKCIVDTDTCRLWYKADDQFQMPKVNAMALLRTNTAYAEGPMASVLASLWSEVVHEQCNVFSYAASMAGLHCDFGNTRSGMEIHVSGYNHKAGVLLQRIVDTIQELPSQLTDELFVRIQDKLDKQFMAFMVAQPYQHAMYAADLCLEQPKFPIQDRMDCLKEVTKDDLVSFSQRLVSRMQLEILLHGNITAQEATDLSRILTEGFKPKAPFSLPQLRVVRLDPGRDYVYRLEGMNEQDSNNCVSNYYQMGEMDVRTNAALSVLHHLLREPAFNQLRTEEQLGYIVHSSVKTNGDNIKGVLILIQGDAQDPIFMNDRIEVFLESFRTKLVQMTVEDFENNVDSVCQSLLQKDKSLGEESSRYWHVITNRSYRFRRLADIAREARTLNKTEVLRLYDRYLLRGSPTRQKLSVQIFGTNHRDKLDEETNAEVLIKDTAEFGRGQSLSPVQTKVLIDDYVTDSSVQ